MPDLFMNGKKRNAPAWMQVLTILFGDCHLYVVVYLHRQQEQ
jgi:hypothetical protein